MNLRDLQYLVSVADLGNFGRAAEACHVSQPTLSMQIRKLEEELGVQLIERTNRKLMLTPTGEEVVRLAREILEREHQIRTTAKDSRDPFAGEVRFGAFPTLAPYAFPFLVPAIRDPFPKLRLLLREEKTPELIAQLEAGIIDCAMIAMPVESAMLQHAELFTEPFYLAVPAAHRLASRKSVSMEDLTQEQLLLLDEGHCLRDQALSVCRSIGVGESGSFRATSMETLRQMVAGGNAVTFIPELAVRHDDATVRYLPFARHAPSRTIGLYWRKTSARKILFEKLAEIIRDTARQHQSGIVSA